MLGFVLSVTFAHALITKLDSDSVSSDCQPTRIDEELFFSAERAAVLSSQDPFVLRKSPAAGCSTSYYWGVLKTQFSQLLLHGPLLNIMGDKIAFVFDEARVLLRSHIKKDCNFVLLRRAFSHFPREVGYLCPLALMTDTVAKISNLAPVQSRDPSGRVSNMQCKIFPPFYVLANVDIWVHKDVPLSLADMADWKYYCRYGRPHWGALAQQIQSNQVRLSIAQLMNVARMKILCGDGDMQASSLAQKRGERPHHSRHSRVHRRRTTKPREP